MKAALSGSRCEERGWHKEHLLISLQGEAVRDLAEQGLSQGMPRAPSKGWPPVPQREGEPSHEPQEEWGWHSSSLVILVDLSAFTRVAM